MFPTLSAICRSWIERLRRRLSDVFASRAAEAVDPEIREVFLAELDEIAETLAALLPKCQTHALSQADLQSIRRAFHTLKGSGQIAGERALGGFWGQIEQLAARVLEKKLKPTPDLLATIEGAMRLLPDCARSIRESSGVPSTLSAMARNATRLLGGQ